MQNQKSAIGLDGNVTALIGYLVGIVALVLIFIEKDNRFVRFHAIQSVLWGFGIAILWIVIIVVGIILGFGLAMISSTLAWLVWMIFILVYFALFFALFGGLIFGAIKSYQGQMFKLPIVGSMAEKWT
ncbi:MAG TPA: hypothetical protein VGJ02_11295 [Pyrinomonadaceae bacterium]|jgi:uncharacterized membrane protein